MSTPPLLPSAPTPPPPPPGQPSPAPALPLPPPVLALEVIARLLSVPARWTILRELARGEVLPVSEIAARARVEASVASRHMATLKEMGLAEQIYGRLYRLSSNLHPDPATGLLDLGHCLLRLDPPKTA